MRLVHMFMILRVNLETKTAPNEAGVSTFTTSFEQINL
jgi:hypothetical protein